MFNLQNEQDRMWLTMGLSEVLVASIHVAVPEGSNDWNDVTLVGASKPSLEVAVAAFTAYKNKAQLARLRYERDLLLAETDWWAVSDRTMTAEQTAYRQALRDITNTYSSLDDVVWPEKPL